MKSPGFHRAGRRRSLSITRATKLIKKILGRSDIGQKLKDTHKVKLYKMIMKNAVSVEQRDIKLYLLISF